MLASNNFTENFSAQVLEEIFWNVWNSIQRYPQLFSLVNLSITIESNQSVGKKTGCLIFCRNKESQFLLDTLH